MVRRKLAALALTAAFAALSGPISAQPPLPEAAFDLHMGVASCATSVCHGKVAPDPAANVWLNEYRVWMREDYHSRAYRTLLTPQSKAIAEKLGLQGAQTAKICLDCHADNVPADRRGPRFQISDGVGCEACHGGAGRYLESHAERGTNHDDNIAAGLYPTEDPLARARLCLSCHLGTKDKFATHQIMGAGHPRLSFELETFTVNQPAHYTVDDDYRERKPTIASVNMWLAGLSVASLQTVELLQEEWFTKPALVPELSFFQCHACHHPMNDLQWQPEGGARALPPGAVRLNDSTLQVLIAVLTILAPDATTALSNSVHDLHAASQQGRQQVVASARALQSQLEPLVERLAGGDYSEAQMRRLRAELLTAAGGGRFRHFTAAEQVFLAVETLCIALDESQKCKATLDRLYTSVTDENAYVPAQFAVLARQMQAAL